jgi:MerR HTH family regulatory protein
MKSMETQYLVAIDEFCSSHNIEISFISSLQQSGLIDITTISDSAFIAADQLQQLEKFVRLYYELDINLEGIETINYLLHRINSMQDDITTLRNRLRIYETEF